MRDSSAEQSIVFPSHTSIPIYRDVTKSERPVRQTMIHEASPPSPAFEGRYFEVALIFLWSSREQPRNIKRGKSERGQERERRLFGGRRRRDQGFVSVWNELKHSVVTQRSRNPVHFLWDTLTPVFYKQSSITRPSTSGPSVFIKCWNKECVWNPA